MLLLLALFGLGEPGPSIEYRFTPVDPAVAMPFDYDRKEPWSADYTTAFTAELPAAFLPAPVASDYGSSIQVAQAAPQPDLEQENMDLRRRIEQLESMMEGVLTQPPVAGPQPVIPTSGMKSVPGWVAELYDWNRAGRLGDDPLKTILTRNCPFRGDFGHASGTDMYIYRFLSTFRVKEQGRYVLASETTMGSGHGGGFQVFVDGGKIIDHDGQTSDNAILQNGLPLSVGDHTIEFRTWIGSNSFIKYEPAARHRWFPLVKGPGDLNAREFREDELFAQVPASTRGAVQGCNY